MDKITTKVLEQMFPGEKIPKVSEKLENELVAMAKKLHHQADITIKEIIGEEDDESLKALGTVKKIGEKMVVLFYLVGKMGKYDYRVKVLDLAIEKYRTHYKKRGFQKVSDYLHDQGIRFYLSSCMIAGVIKGRDGKDNTDVIINSSRILKEDVK